jgi:ribonuclease HI
MKTVTVYTDGACSGNPGPGGWGAILIWNGKTKELSGGEAQSTNNRMEMRAVIEALKAMKEPCIVRIHSDSALIINAFTQGWIPSWQSRGWRKADKKPVENRDLWEEMLNAMKPHKVEWIKVKGHSDDELNNRADQIAVEASKKYQ